jgi:hypothetical protein
LNFYTTITIYSGDGEDLSQAEPKQFMCARFRVVWFRKIFVRIGNIDDTNSISNPQPTAVLVFHNEAGRLRAPSL